MIQTRMMRLALVLLALPAVRAQAAELELRFAALERILAEQLFTQDGRHYVRGNKSTHCQFAYLEKPHIDADGDRLRVAARFSGRSALDLLGGCVGLGDSFDLVPLPRRPGSQRRDRAEGREGHHRAGFLLHSPRPRSAGAKHFEGFQNRGARPGSQAAGAAGRRVSTGTRVAFDLTEIRITPDALVLVIEFRMVIK